MSPFAVTMAAMAELAIPTVRLRRFGAELRAIREERGLSIQAVSSRVGRSDSALSKLENGRTFMWPRDVNQVLAGYGITDPATRKMLHTLMRNGRKRGWWQHYKNDLPPEGIDYMRLESDAAKIMNFQPLVIPGIAQTPEYARIVIGRRTRPHPNDEDRIVAVRMNRQKLLGRAEPPQFHLLVGEAAIRLTVGGRDVMHAQLQHLLSVSRLPHVTLQVLPFEAGFYLGATGSYVILEFAAPESFSVVFLEILTGALWIERDDLVQRHRQAFGDASDLALSVAESQELIERVAGELKTASNWDDRASQAQEH